jgi:hypothetical protein
MDVQDHQTVRPAPSPRATRSFRKTGGEPRLRAEANVESYPGGRILEVQYHEFEFDVSGGDWQFDRRRLDLPPGWQTIVTSVSQWDLSFLPDDHHLGLLGVSSTLGTLGGEQLLYAWAVLRDKNTDDSWKALITIQVIILD